MDIPGITWKGDSIEDVEILRELPADLLRVLSDTNGFSLHAFPPFCFQKSGAGASLTPLPATDVILFHADLAKQIRNVPDGGQVEIKVIH